MAEHLAGRTYVMGETREGEEPRVAMGPPFVPLRIGPSGAAGEQVWRFSCKNLLPDGRCGDYENRPNGPCVVFEPGVDMLCAMYDQQLSKRRLSERLERSNAVDSGDLTPKNEFRQDTLSEVETTEDEGIT